MNPLPQDIAAPMHMIPAWITWVFYILVAMGAGWLVWRYWKRHQAAKAHPASLPQPAPVVIDIDSEIKAILHKASNGSCREALFDLSAVMREYVDSTHPGLSITRMTAYEITVHMGADGPVAFFQDLQDPLFGIAEPGPPKVKELCKRATAVAKGPATSPAKKKKAK